jgi:formylglycine-generating enzyme required for sulfatase activity
MKFYQRQKKLKYLLLLFCFATLITTVQPVLAHKVQISSDVGATLHIEPNDNPRAGEPTKAWFALTRKGGQAIPLAQCNCKLAVYAEPHTPGEPALLEPSLQPVTAERFQGIPGTEITFPKPGIYELQLNGKPAKGVSFKPFELKFEVTVAAGTANVQNVQNVNSDVAQENTKTLPLWAIAIPILGLIAIAFAFLQGTRRS